MSAPTTPEGVIVITGIMAAGKSTVAQALAERLPRAAHVRGDVFRRMIVSGRQEYEPGAGAGGGGGAPPPPPPPSPQNTTAPTPETPPRTSRKTPGEGGGRGR
ncbi:AAA family ATPase, partial [Streptomyces alboflavus]|uniref:AAA family ATPase n=1 Tax=Streptomyces alboflavus TaxID=67267 RepID=UPI0036B316FD